MEQQTTPITRRAVIIGLLAVIGFTVAGCFCLLLRYEIIGTGYLPRGAIALLMLFVLFNAGLGFIARKLRLGRHELMLIFIMLMVMAAIPGQEYAQHVYLNLLGIVYYTTPDIASPELYLDNLNPALVPAVDRMAPPIRWAFEGLPAGQGVPWHAWIGPLLVWTPYFFALYWMLTCFAAILAARWEDHEKLLYPLMQVPTEMIEDGQSLLPGLLRNPLMWICFALSCSLYIVKGIHTYYPTFPDINLQKSTQHLFSGPGAAFNYVPIHFYPEMVGIAYLLTSEVGFSLWFFYLLARIEEFGRNLVGITTGHYRFFEMQTAGGYVVLAGALLWSARHYIARVFSYAFGVGRAPVSRTRSQPYRLAVIGFLISFVFIIAWAVYIGMSFTWALVLFSLLPLAQMIVARVICEAGMFIYSTPFRLDELVFRMAGTQNIGPRNVTLMTAVSWVQIRSTATQYMAQPFQGLKLSSVMNFDRTRMMWVMAAAIVVAILTSHIVSPYTIYHWSVPKLGWWPSGSSLNTTRKLASFLRNPTHMTLGWWLSFAAGGAMTAFLVVMRQRYLWWPFHPAGFVAWLGWPIERYWMSILIGWLGKTAVMRFGGYKTFNTLRPAAFGLILGICFILTFWIVFHFFVEGPPLIIE